MNPPGTFMLILRWNQFAVHAPLVLDNSSPLPGPDLIHNCPDDAEAAGRMSLTTKLILALLTAALIATALAPELKNYLFAGHRSAEAAERLLAAGHARAFQLDGGLFAWKEAGFATET